MTENIFQEIWDADQNGNGVPALRTNELKDESKGYVVVDERSEATPADHNVLKEIKIPDHKLETYKLCERMLDNYALDRSKREIVNQDEVKEEIEFIDKILTTPPIKTARDYLEKALNLTITHSIMAAMIKESWFTIGKAGNQPDASGFEHVFVGEQASKTTEVGGYHFWYKYFLDDGGQSILNNNSGKDRIKYLRTRYEKSTEPEKGVLIPEIVTLQLEWDAPGGHGGSDKILKKPIGGFFVGCSPEGIIALGLVRCRSRSPKIAKINGSEYQLDLHRLDGQSKAIRTFFPRFIKSDTSQIIPSETECNTPGSSVVSGDGEFKVVAAMVNPVNPEGGREFLQIINTSNDNLSLLGWKIIAPNGTAFVLSDNIVGAGEVFKFTFPSSQGSLRNSGGSIQLFNPDEILVNICEYTAQEASKEGCPILF